MQGLNRKCPQLCTRAGIWMKIELLQTLRRLLIFNIFFN